MHADRPIDRPMRASVGACARALIDANIWQSGWSGGVKNAPAAAHKLREGSERFYTRLRLDLRRYDRVVVRDRRESVDEWAELNS